MFFGLIALWFGGRSARAEGLLQYAEQELLRAQGYLFQQEEPAYWLGMNISDVFAFELIAEEGALFEPKENRERYADIDVRVGDISFDNTHPFRDSGASFEESHFGTYLPIEDKPEAIRTHLWKEMDKAYRHSLRRLVKLRSNHILKVEMDDKSPDFSLYPPQNDIQELNDHILNPDEYKQWSVILKNASTIFSDKEHIFSSSVRLSIEREDSYVLNTEGTRLRTQRLHYRLSLYAMTKADDGMNIRVYDYIDANSLDGLPSSEEISVMVHDCIQKLLALRDAPLVDPYVGPAILRGRAAAVFFHEILGHRIEGHRQKDEYEGQTLTDKIGTQIFPTFLSVSDNPLLSKWQDIDLNGHYQYDDEGSRAENVSLVENGVLRGFLMSRAPIEGFASSNGHGRSESNHSVVARQGNLIVSASKTVSYETLRMQLIEELKRQQKPFGLIFDDISGGFTFTGRNSPNSYSVQPVTVWKVFADGRKDLLVRGVDLIGTPLMTFSRIVGASDQIQVFNGVCGAESGYVPVSAIAPDLLVQEIEVQRKEKDFDKLPILFPPRGAR